MGWSHEKLNISTMILSIVKTLNSIKKHYISSSVVSLGWQMIKLCITAQHFVGLGQEQDANSVEFQLV